MYKLFTPMTHIIKKSEQTVDQLLKEIETTKRNSLLPENLKAKYVALLEKMIKEKEAEKEKLAKGGTLPLPKGKEKIKKVMGEFSKDKLKTSAGKKVKSPKQAVAIALSEQRAEEKTGKGVKILAQGISQENKELIARELAKIAKRKKLK